MLAPTTVRMAAVTWPERMQNVTSAVDRRESGLEQFRVQATQTCRTSRRTLLRHQGCP